MREHQYVWHIRKTNSRELRSYSLIWAQWAQNSQLCNVWFLSPRAIYMYICSRLYFQVQVVQIRYPNIRLSDHFKQQKFYIVTFIGEHKTSRRRKKSILAGANVFVLPFAWMFLLLFSLILLWNFFLKKHTKLMCGFFKLVSKTYYEQYPWEIWWNQIIMHRIKH